MIDCRKDGVMKTMYHHSAFHIKCFKDTITPIIKHHLITNVLLSFD